MKNCAGILIIALAVTASAETLRVPAAKRDIIRPTPPPSLLTEDVEGVVPRALRGGNPLEMLNPNAPGKYGTAAQSVILDPDTGKWKGIKLLQVDF
jgi:hypothetical protein